MNMEWLTPEEVSLEWGIKARRIQALCSNGQIATAIRKGRMWLIPQGTVKPIDGRTKAAKKTNEHNYKISTVK